MDLPVDLPGAPPAHPYAAEIERERDGWHELTSLCRVLTPDERLDRGYFPAERWSVKDMVAHIGTWLAEAETQLHRIAAGTFVDEPLDVDAMNARFLEAMRGEPWESVWTQAHAARGEMLSAWFALGQRSEPADRWVRKSGADHYAEHLGRLREWAAELQARRPAPADRG